MKKSIIIFCIVCLLITSCELNAKQDYLPLLQKIEEVWIPNMEPLKEYPCSVSGTDVVAAFFTEFGLMNHQVMFLDENHEIVGTVGRIVTSTASTYKGTEQFCIVIDGTEHHIN